MVLIMDQTFTSWCYPSGPQRLWKKFSLPHLPQQSSMFRLAGKPDSHNRYIFYLELVIQLKRPQKYVLPVRHQTTALHGGFYVVGQSIRKRGGGRVSKSPREPPTLWLVTRGQNKLELQLLWITDVKTRLHQLHILVETKNLVFAFHFDIYHATCSVRESKGNWSRETAVKTISDSNEILNVSKTLILWDMLKEWNYNSECSIW